MAMSQPMTEASVDFPVSVGRYRSLGMGASMDSL
jgi:hypothetical protein